MVLVRSWRADHHVGPGTIATAPAKRPDICTQTHPAIDYECLQTGRSPYMRYGLWPNAPYACQGHTAIRRVR